MDRTALNEEDCARMLWAEDPEGSGRFKLLKTEELVNDYYIWLAGECNHSELGIVCIFPSNGAPMYREQCFDCGRPSGQWIAKSRIANLGLVRNVEPSAQDDYRTARLTAWRAIQREHALKQLSTDSSDYALYLRSPAWADKRRKVFQRAKNVCEGCGEHPPRQVHHLTYRHIKNELLWELVAVCDLCHDRVHQEDDR